MRTLTWERLLTWSLAGLVLSFLGIMAVFMVFIPPLLVFAVLYVALIVALRRWPKRWLYIVTAVLVALALVLNLPFIYEDLLHPESFSGFVSGLVPTIFAIVAIVAALGAAMGWGAAAARPLALGSVATIAVLAAFSVVMTATAGDDEMAEGDIQVVAEDVEYPERLEATAGDIVFFIENRDNFRHTFVIEGQGVKQEVPAARDRRVAVNLRAGEYRFLCDVPGHDTVMFGTLVVR
jgi:plastocyanin